MTNHSPLLTNRTVLVNSRYVHAWVELEQLNPDQTGLEIRAFPTGNTGAFLIGATRPYLRNLTKQWVAQLEDKATGVSN